MNRRRFIKRASGLLVPAAFGIFVPRLLRAQAQRPYPLVSSKRGVSGCSGTTVDWLHRMEVGTNGNTPSLANLDSGTYGLGTGSWSKTGADGFWTRNSGVNYSVPGLTLSGGSGCGDSTGGVSAMTLNSIPGDRFAVFTWGASKATICVGYVLHITGNISNLDTGDIFNPVRLMTSASKFFTSTIEIENTDLFMMYAHSDGPDGGHITGLAKNTSYWVTMKMDTTTSCRLRVYTLAGLTQQGSESVSVSGGTNACTAVRCFGLTDTTGQTTTNANVLHQSDIAARFADVHPLLPT